MEIEKILRTEWITFRNKKVSFGTVDHQHLSNLFYYWKFAAKGYDNSIFDHLFDFLVSVDIRCGNFPDALTEMTKIIQRVLDYRFNGQLLPYRPHIKFEYELRALKKLGYLQEDGKIIVDGKQIGEIISTENFN